MMNKCILFMFLVILASALAAPPAEREENGQLLLSRVRRLTCDALSFETAYFSFKHSACAVKCIAQGHCGGTCIEGRCKCYDNGDK